MTEQQDTMEQDTMEQEAQVINMDSLISKGPSGKEVQERKAEDKRVREHNKQFLDEAEMRYRNAELNTMMIEVNVRAMKSFIESETLRHEYLKCVEAKEKRDTPQEPSRIIT